MRYLTRLFLCLILVVTLVGVAQPTSPAIAQENLLENGGFEGNYVSIGGDPSLQVAPNWQPWSLPAPAGAPSSVNLRPDYQPAPANRVRSGNAAQEYNTFFATHDGGVYQRVPVSNGAELEFSIYVYVWSSGTFADADESVQPQDVDVQVGIDPFGGQDGSSDSIVWSDPERFYDEYRELSVTAVAQANAVSVWVRTNPQGAVGVNNIYLDDAELIQTGQQEAEPEDPTPTPEGLNGDDDATPEETDDPSDMDDMDDETDMDATEEAIATQTEVPEEVAEFPNRLTYPVVAGDTVSSIATAFNSTTEAVIAANGLNENGLIIIGQQLVIPVPAGQGEPAATPTPSATEDDGQGGQGDDDAMDDNGNGGQQSATPGTYVVQPGDNLFRIALRFNTTVEALATLNNISNANSVIAGTVLQVPTGGGTVPGGGGTNSGQTYTVVPGDNAFRIALRFGVTVEQLAAANGIANPNLIFVGQQLLIP